MASWLTEALPSSQTFMMIDMRMLNRELPSMTQFHTLGLKRAMLIGVATISLSDIAAFASSDEPSTHGSRTQCAVSETGAIISGLDGFADNTGQNFIDHSVPVNARDLLPEDRTSFRYRGSSTTPPYSGGVSRSALDTPLTVGSNSLRNSPTVSGSKPDLYSPTSAVSS
jgi:hypothetical protein